MSDSGEIVERADVVSHQPRITPGAKVDPDLFYDSVMRWSLDPEFMEVEYARDTRERDKYLSRIWMKEPHLAGVLNGAVLIDANRGWSLTGGRNQVNRYVQILHNLESGEGYGYYQRRSALAFRTSDLGSITEIGRDGQDGPMRMMWNVDPTRCRATPDGITYYPPRGKVEPWPKSDYFKVVSMPSIEEDMYGVGFCAVSRAIAITKIMLGLVNYDQEKLNAKAPKGFLLMKGISQEQWNNAMADKEIQMTQKERRYFGGVFVFAGLNDIVANLVSLSQLPEEFDRVAFTDILMYTYALVMGYSPDEFWPVRFGSLGRGTEAEVQHRKAVIKGGADYTTLWTEKVQHPSIIPISLLFQFEQRDITGEIEDARLMQEKGKAIRILYDPAGTLPGIINQEQAQILAAQWGVIPDEWTVNIEPVTVTEDEPVARVMLDREVEERRQLFCTDQVLRAAYTFPNEPIVKASYKNGVVTYRILKERGGELRSNRSFFAPPAAQVRRAVTTLYDDPELQITSDDVALVLAGAKEIDPEFKALLSAKIE